MATSCTLLADKSAIRRKVVGVQGCWDSVEYEEDFRELLESQLVVNRPHFILNRLQRRSRRNHRVGLQ